MKQSEREKQWELIYSKENKLKLKKEIQKYRSIRIAIFLFISLIISITLVIVLVKYTDTSIFISIISVLFVAGYNAACYFGHYATYPTFEMEEDDIINGRYGYWAEYFKKRGIYVEEEYKKRKGNGLEYRQ